MIKVSKETGAYAALVSVVSGAIVWYVCRVNSRSSSNIDNFKWLCCFVQVQLSTAGNILLFRLGGVLVSAVRQYPPADDAAGGGQAAELVPPCAGAKRSETRSILCAHIVLPRAASNHRSRCIRSVHRGSATCAVHRSICQVRHQNCCRSWTR